MTYGKPCSYNIDPIEKKPFFHFWPGSISISIATVGCNFRCLHCFTSETPIVTDSGIFPIEEVFKNPEVKLLTHENRFMKIKKTFKHDYAGDIVEIHSSISRVACTPNHKFFVTEAPDGKIEKIKAEALTTKHFLVVPKACREIKTDFENEKYFFVPIVKISRKYYCGDVYNFEVEEDHSYTASFAAVCNCQNADISQAKPGEVPEFDLPPEKVVQMAQDYGCAGISYTYTEPTVFFEYCYDTGLLARKKKLYNNFVSNAYMTPETVKKSKDFLDACRMDLKGEEEHYLKVCGGVILENVLECIKNVYKAGIHTEIITLVIPGDNDNKNFVVRMADFLKPLSSEIPWHFTRFYPAYKMMDVPPTELKTLEQMHDWAVEAGMKYVYVGNVPSRYESTYCPNCREMLIQRSGFTVLQVNLKRDKKCPGCGTKIPIVGEVKQG
jgi:pyruvate formate lyase activating enzyme